MTQHENNHSNDKKAIYEWIESCLMVKIDCMVIMAGTHQIDRVSLSGISVLSMSDPHLYLPAIIVRAVVLLMSVHCLYSIVSSLGMGNLKGPAHGQCPLLCNMKSNLSL